jgi:single-strand DNA-binding protein
MRGINSVLILGTSGHDPELRRTPKGNLVCDLRVATNRPVKAEEGWTEAADWHRVRLWDSLAETCGRFIKKGQPVAIEGQLRTESWLDAQKVRQSRTFILADRLHLIPQGRIERAEPEASGERETLPVVESEESAEIPF